MPSSATAGNAIVVNGHKRSIGDPPGLEENFPSTNSHNAPKQAVCRSLAEHPLQYSSHLSSSSQFLKTRSIQQLSINNQNTPQPGAFSPKSLDIGRSHQLAIPRSISVKEQSTPKTSLMPVLSTPESTQSPGRSENRPAILRTDTSKSSVFSIFSDISDGSAQTPGTPIEMLQDLPTPFAKNQSYESTSAYIRPRDEELSCQENYNLTGLAVSQVHKLCTGDHARSMLLNFDFY